MSPKLAKSDAVRGLYGRAIARYIKLVRGTSRLTVEPDDAVERYVAATPQIIAMWHGQFMMIPAINPSDEVTTAAMVARHGDGDLLSQALARFDMPLIRGAGAGERKKDRGGRAALVGALRALEQGDNVAMTADVPPSSPRTAGLGIVALAKHSGRPILPVAVASRRFIAFNTWSRMTLNLPFSRLALVTGDPINVPRTADEAALETARAAVEAELNRITTRAYELAGGDLIKATPAAAMAPDAPPLGIGLRLKLYRALTALASPAVPLLLNRRERKGKEDPKRRPERLAQTTHHRPSGPLVWFHAASIGEANAIMPVIHEIARARPDHTMLLTTGTRTSAQLASDRLPVGAIHQVIPFDTPAAMRRFLAHWQPSLAVLTESDLWPNLLVETSARSVPIVLANARISLRSFQRWRKVPGLAGQLFSRIRVVLAQDKSIARRFRSLGARDVRQFGNLKIDAPGQAIDATARARVGMALGNRPVFLAASTHDGEEEIVIAAHKSLRDRVGDLITIIVPRHPERGDAVADAIRASDLSFSRRSRGEMPSAAHEIYLADTIGELALFFDCADAAFIGGSLVPHGGQNPIEAVRAGCPVMTGPRVSNFAEVYHHLLTAGGAATVTDATTMAATAERWLTSAEARAETQAAATHALETLSGALAKTCNVILELLATREPDDATSLKRAS
ncbi:MAG: glycosyltransferase N-terminal domain-containing protein [Pseudomonadota bacterium]